MGMDQEPFDTVMASADPSMVIVTVSVDYGLMDNVTVSGSFPFVVGGAGVDCPDPARSSSR